MSRRRNSKPTTTVTTPRPSKPESNKKSLYRTQGGSLRPASYREESVLLAHAVQRLTDAAEPFGDWHGR